MNDKERFLATMRCQAVDHVIFDPVPIGFWGATFKRWHTEGFDTTVTQYRDIVASFGFVPKMDAEIYFGMCPTFDKVILAEDEDTVTYKLRRY